MMTICPICFELFSELWPKPCCSCGYKTVSLSVELIGVVQMLIIRGFTVTYANCSTHNDKDSSGKATQIRIEFDTDYPVTLFGNLPPDWTISKFNIVRDNQITEPKLTALTCVCVHPPGECDTESTQFDKLLTISNLATWLENKDPESCKALLILSGCL